MYTFTRWLVQVIGGIVIVGSVSRDVLGALILSFYVIGVAAVSYLAGHEDGESKGYKEGFHEGKELGFRQGQNSEQVGRIIYGDRWGKDE
jgi:hypothetical protein